MHKQLDLEYLDWWTKYYASLNDKYRNYEHDELDNNNEDQSQNNHESEKKSLKSLNIFKKKSISIILLQLRYVKSLLIKRSFERLFD
jgi:hypothetical protein